MKIHMKNEGVEFSKKRKIKHVVFEDSTVRKTIVEKFPGAIKSADLAYIVKSKLREHGFHDTKTLLATSLCCDEVNRELEQDFTSMYKYNFSMGGLAGFAFGGITSFGAMAHHIPDDGSCLIIYGPHVGIDRDGVVGKVNRRGRHKGSGICCGSAAAAAAYCRSVKDGAVKASTVSLSVEDAVDAQQTFVANLLLPHADRISSSSDPNVELPLALFDVQHEFMRKIVDKACGEVAGEGKIAILGGVQINTPEGTSEYFLPKVFEIWDNTGALILDMVQDIGIDSVPRLLSVEDNGDDITDEVELNMTNIKRSDRDESSFTEEKKDDDIMIKYDSRSKQGAVMSKLLGDPSITNTIALKFPGAVKSSELAKLIKSVLYDNGFHDTKTLLATSLCCDEVNRELEQDFTSMYKYNFSMGGLAGFAFGGITSFGAMAHHIPDDGSCLIIYGPHVGIDRDGVVGKVNRRGRHKGSGICCGSAAAAAAYCRSVKDGAIKPCAPPQDAVDAQQTFVGNMLLPHADRISSSSDPNVELPLALFDVQHEFMRKIVDKACGEVAGEGKIAILGGVQINTPEGTSEYFLPKVFEIRDNTGALVIDVIGNVKESHLENIPHLLTVEDDDDEDVEHVVSNTTKTKFSGRDESSFTEEKKDDDIMITYEARSRTKVPPSLSSVTKVLEDPTVTNTIALKFPGAVKSSELATLIKSVLYDNGFHDTKTLLATSLCCDEVNRELEQDFTSMYKYNFSMGGLAGFAFGGITSFGAMAHHIPDDGSCLIVYGPHVGIDRDGVVGKVNRRGRHKGSGICCGSAAAAAAYCRSVKDGAIKPCAPPQDAVDAQQTYVANMLLPHADRISSSSDPNVELPLALFDVQHDFMRKIVDKACGEVAGEGKIAILGGVQINTPEGTSEYFLPKVFEIRDNRGMLVSNLLYKLNEVGRVSATRFSNKSRQESLLDSGTSEIICDMDESEVSVDSQRDTLKQEGHVVSLVVGIELFLLLLYFTLCK